MRKKKNKSTEISEKSRLIENLETLLNLFGNSNFEGCLKRF